MDELAAYQRRFRRGGLDLSRGVLDEVTAEMRETFAARSRYLLLRAG